SNNPMPLLALAGVTFDSVERVFLIKRRQCNKPAVRMPYQLKQPLYTLAQRSQLERREQADGSDHRFLAKVRLADVVEVTAIPRRGPWYHATNRISAASFDFLLCNKQDLAPVCAVEIEDASDANAPLEELCQAIGLPLVRLTQKSAGS